MTQATRAVSVLAVLAVAGVAVSGCGGRKDAPKADSGGTITCEVVDDTRVGIATGNATGVYFTLGNAYAEQISAATAGRVKATAAETGASVQNIQQVVAGTYQVAFALADTAADAVAGEAAFQDKQPIAALARLYPNYTQVIARKDSGITGIESMRGKRISTGSPGSGTEVIANRLLEAAGLNPESDVAGQRLDLTKTVDGMKEGAIDAMFFSGGLPTPGITDLITTAREEVTFVDVTPLLAKMQTISGAYQPGLIPAAAYGLPADVPTITVANLLVARDDLDADLGCVLTKALFERKPQLEQSVPAAKGISLDTARDTAPVPLNRGSQRALDDLKAPE